MKAVISSQISLSLRGLDRVDSLLGGGSQKRIKIYTLSILHELIMKKDLCYQKEEHMN